MSWNISLEHLCCEGFITTSLKSSPLTLPFYLQPVRASRRSSCRTWRTRTWANVAVAAVVPSPLHHHHHTSTTSTSTSTTTIYPEGNGAPTPSSPTLPQLSGPTGVPLTTTERSRRDFLSLFFIIFFIYIYIYTWVCTFPSRSLSSLASPLLLTRKRESLLPWRFFRKFVYRREGDGWCFVCSFLFLFPPSLFPSFLPSHLLQTFAMPLSLSWVTAALAGRLEHCIRLSNARCVEGAADRRTSSLHFVPVLCYPHILWLLARTLWLHSLRWLTRLGAPLSRWERIWRIIPVLCPKLTHFSSHFVFEKIIHCIICCVFIIDIGTW